MKILRTSSKSGAGMEAWLECLAEEKRARCVCGHLARYGADMIISGVAYELN